MLLSLLLVACDATGDSRDAGGGSDAGPRVDAALADAVVDVAFSDTASPDSALPDGARPDAALPDGATPDAALPDAGAPLSRGLRWTRDNAMFISGLTPSMGVPSAGAVSTYLDDFGATSIHLWQAALPAAINGWLTHRSDARYITWTLPNGTSSGAGVLGGHAPGSGRIGYQIGDEPRNMEELDAILEGARAVRAADPNALIIVNFGVVEDGRDPGTGGLLDTMVQHTVDSELVDVLSHDNYSFSRGGYAWLEAFRTVGLRNGLPVWRYLSSYVHDDRHATESDTRWHAMLGVTYGYTGHSWFIYQIAPEHMLQPELFAGPGSFDAPRRETFGWAAQINRELEVYGRTLTQLTSTAVAYVADVELGRPDGTRGFSAGMGGDPHLRSIEAVSGSVIQDSLLGFFVDDRGERYLVVQNPNHDGASFPPGSDDTATFRLSFEGITAVERLDARNDRIVTDTISGGALSLTLEAGDVAMLKYPGGVWAGR